MEFAMCIDKIEMTTKIKMGRLKDIHFFFLDSTPQW